MLGVAVVGEGSGVLALTVPYFSLFLISVSIGLEVLLFVSRALVGHGVCSVTSVCDLGRPVWRLGAGGAGLSCWRGGVWIIVPPPY